MTVQLSCMENAPTVFGLKCKKQWTFWRSYTVMLISFVCQPTSHKKWGFSCDSPWLPNIIVWPLLITLNIFQFFFLIEPSLNLKQIKTVEVRWTLLIHLDQNDTQTSFHFHGSTTTVGRVYFLVQHDKNKQQNICSTSFVCLLPTCVLCDKTEKISSETAISKQHAQSYTPTCILQHKNSFLSY